MTSKHLTLGSCTGTPGPQGAALPVAFKLLSCYRLVCQWALEFQVVAHSESLAVTPWVLSGGESALCVVGAAAISSTNATW